MNASTQPMIAFDEFGRPFVILRDQSTKKRLAGLEAQKVATSWSKTEELTDLSSPLSHPVIKSTLVPMICCKIELVACMYAGSALVGIVVCSRLFAPSSTPTRSLSLHVTFLPSWALSGTQNCFLLDSRRHDLSFFPFAISKVFRQ